MSTGWLDDGRRVVVKAYRRDIDVAHLGAVAQVQAQLHDPAVRRVVAGGLVQLIEAAQLRPGLVSWREAYGRLWRRPHDARFDFAATAQGAEWIDELAADTSTSTTTLGSSATATGESST